jgi:hypothetical protein
MTTPNYSKAALLKFIEDSARQGLVKTNTAAGWRAACTRILEDTPDDEDVRKIDAASAVQRYHNKHTGELRPDTLGQYQRRLNIAVTEFSRFTENPTGYKPYGRVPSKADEDPDGTARKKDPQRVKLAENIYVRTVPPSTASGPQRVQGLTLDFPMRADFLAQVVVPRDMKSYEARRLASFILTLADDFTPKEVLF